MEFVKAGQRIVDLGTGTGSLGRLFAERGCRVTGVDISAPLVDEARALDNATGVDTSYVNAPAEATGLAADAFDLVCAGQCWHWFDRPAAAREAKRLLRDDGTIVIAHFDWLPFTGNVVAATEGLILQYNPSWPFARGAGIYPQWLTDLREGGFPASRRSLSMYRFPTHTRLGSGECEPAPRSPERLSRMRWSGSRQS